ncbi:MAG: AIR synthase-related protein [Alphaproteobacteria bacterium]|nr:AIR synthase-related protein [Alphaproteobacteria bacterium]
MSETGYEKLGVSPTKEDVREAIKNQSKGLFPGAFCKIIDDVAGDPKYCSIIHADGAGTKSTLAYLAYKEHGDASAFRGIAQDSAVMNLDDMACVGAVDNFVFSNTIGRNAHRVGKDALGQIVEGYQAVFDMLKGYDIGVAMAGGETADVGDLVATIIVDSTVFARLPRSEAIDASAIKPGNVIIGLASFGQATYENAYNSGIGSNGITRARHLMLKHDYATKYPESFSSTLSDDLIYQGKYGLDDPLPGSSVSVGDALLSPTRTYLPVMKDVYAKYREDISGVIHCSGGGLTKSLHFGSGLHYYKTDLFDAPPLFEAMLDTGNITLSEACKVFNMGQRYEIYASEAAVNGIVAIARRHGVEAKVIGEVRESKAAANRLTIQTRGQELTY